MLCALRFYGLSKSVSRVPFPYFSQKNTDDSHLSTRYITILLQPPFESGDIVPMAGTLSVGVASDGVYTAGQSPDRR